MADLKQKFGDLQAVITVLAVFLMMPPVIRIFNDAGSLNNVPVVVVFIFGAWIVLILLTWWLTRKITSSNIDQPSAPPSQIDGNN